MMESSQALCAWRTATALLLYGWCRQQRLPQKTPACGAGCGTTRCPQFQEFERHVAEVAVCIERCADE